MKRFLLACSIGALSACSSSGSTTNPPADGADAATDPSKPTNVPPGSYTIDFGDVTVAAGEEHTRCVTKRLGNEAAMHVGSIKNLLSQGSHHLIVYRVSDTVEKTAPYDCRPFQDTLDPTKGSPVMITQKKVDDLVLPDGVAYALDANQMIRLEMHYINPGSAPITVNASSTMIPIDEAAFKQEADVLLIGSSNINLPPQAATTLGPVYLGLPAAFDGVSFFAITGHEHQYGTNVKVSTATSATDTGSSVYDVPDWLWSEPKTLFTNPAFTVPKGGGFKLTCDWNNTSAKAVTFGESAEDEMCFFWAYYSPRKPGTNRVLLSK